MHSTCVLLHPPGMQLYAGVGEGAVVPPRAAVPDILPAQIKLAHDAQRTNLFVGHVVSTDQKHQAPERQSMRSRERHKSERGGEMSERKRTRSDTHAENTLTY